MSRIKIHDIIHGFLPSTNREMLSIQIDSALSRLNKRYIRYWQKENEFCLTHDEHHRILTRLAEKENTETLFFEEITNCCERYFLEEIEESYRSNALNDLMNRIPRVIERFLLRKGETFVSAVVTGNSQEPGFEYLSDIVIDDLTKFKAEGNLTQHMPGIVNSMVQEILTNPTESAQMYLRTLANSYTLFSFLNATPDVQAATRKLFSHGTVWLDTTVLLPVFAERLSNDDSQWKFTHLFQTCNEVGIELRVTPGILEEINAHMNFSFSCSHYAPSAWQGDVPYLYSQYLQSGLAASEFRKWLALFRGDERPEGRYCSVSVRYYWDQETGSFRGTSRRRPRLTLGCRTPLVFATSTPSSANAADG